MTAKKLRGRANSQSSGNMRRLSVSLVFLLGVAAAQAAFPNDLYVDNVAGDDGNDGRLRAYGGTNSGPFRTIAKALREAKKGDRIVLAKTDEPYRESITLQGGENSGTSLMPFTIVGNGAVLDGTAPVPATAWEHYRKNVFRFLPQLLHHQALYLDGKPLERVVPTTPDVVPELKSKQWVLLGGWIYFGVDADRIPPNYDLYYAKAQVGITLYQVDYVAIEDLTIQGFQLDGINAHDLVHGAAIAGCTIRGNGRSGISVGGASRVTIEGCLVGDNFAAQVRTEGYCRVEIQDCDLVESADHGPPIAREGGSVLVDGAPAEGNSGDR